MKRPDFHPDLDYPRDPVPELVDRCYTDPPANVSPLRQLGRVNRVEVIDEDGRAYVAHGITVTAAIQDNGHTLKVFVRPGGDTA